MNLYPNSYFNKVENISIDFLIKKKIKLLILDADNTLIDINQNMPANIKAWVKDLLEQGIIIYILSNTNDEKKVRKVSEQLNNIPYKFLAKKPFKFGFKKIQKEVNINPQNIAVVGDQIFTDVLGGNRCNMYTILVEPVDKEKDYFYTAWKRPIENILKRKIEKMINKEDS